MKLRFALVYVALAAIAAAALAVAYLAYAAGPRAPHRGAARYAIEEADWGHARMTGGRLQFMLGPSLDQRSRYEIGFGQRVLPLKVLSIAGKDEHADAYGLPWAIEHRCEYRAHGYGVRVVIDTGACVPRWATVSSDPAGRHPAQWIRVENLSGQTRMVLIAYSPP
ncbi:MAG TPA: hypothetical protein VE570_10565 [Thermoleophilaceae bacterium]|nr:hypothetical protein [Thermoleophilaceae bacterium]